MAAPQAPTSEWAFVLYAIDGPVLWHQRLLLGRVASSENEYVVATPDGDVYCEDLGNQSAEIQAARLSPQRWPPPPGVPRARVYRFRDEPTFAERTYFRAEGVMAANERFEEIQAAHGLPAALPLGPNGALEGLGPRQAPAAAAAVVAAPLQGLPAGLDPAPQAVGGGGVDAGAGGVGTWVSAETTAAHRRGDPVTLNGTETLKGIRGVIEIPVGSGNFLLLMKVPDEEMNEFRGREAAGDARLLEVSVIDSRRVRRMWRDAVKEMKEVTFLDWPIPGPRTASWCVSFLNRRGGGPTDHHKWWKSTNKLFADMWGVSEHECILKAVEHAACYDYVDILNMAGFEHALRRAQLIEYTYSERGPAGGGREAGNIAKDNQKRTGKGADKVGLYDESAVFMGLHREFGDVMVSPELLDYVAKEVEREASVMKQVRKAREERRHLSAPDAK